MPCAGWGRYCRYGLYGSEQLKPMSPTRSGQGAGNHWTPVSIESFAMRWAGSCHERMLLPQFVAPPLLSGLLRPAGHKSHCVWKCQAQSGCKSRVKVRQSRHVSLRWKHNANDVSQCEISTGNVLLRCAFYPWTNCTRPCSCHVSCHPFCLRRLVRQKWNWNEASGQLPSPCSPREAPSALGS